MWMAEEMRRGKLRVEKDEYRVMSRVTLFMRKPETRTFAVSRSEVLILFLVEELQLMWAAAIYLCGWQSARGEGQTSRRKD